MSVVQVWGSAVLLGILLHHGVTAQIPCCMGGAKIPEGGTNIPREFGMGVPNSRGCQIPNDTGMCDVPLRAGFMQVTDTTFPIGSIVDADLVFFRETLRFTEEEIDREREAAIDFFNQRFGLDYSSIEPDELGQRVLGNTTFRPVYFPYNATLVHNQWLLNRKSRTNCYQLGDGGSRQISMVK